MGLTISLTVSIAIGSAVLIRGEIVVDLFLMIFMKQADKLLKVLNY